MELNDFIQNFAEQFDETPAEDFNANTLFKELDDWSSLVALSVISMIDEEYEVTLKSDDMKAANTVGELFEIVKAKL